MSPRFRRFGWGIPLVIAFVLWAGEGQTYAQTLNEGWDKLEREYAKERPRLGDFRKGTKVNADDPNDVRAIDLLAKFYTYSVYLQHLEIPPPGKPSGIDRSFFEFRNEVTALLDPKERQSLQSMSEVFREKIRLHALEVLEFEQARPIHKLHNARVLAMIAELGQGALADTLIKVLKDAKQTDGVRYYALRGLGTLLEQVQPADMTPVLTKDEQSRCGVALVEFLEQRKGPEKNASPEEVEGFRLFRREAVHALAQLHVPAVNDKVRPALVLARFAGNDERIQPPPRIDERVEAALGLARMQTAQNERYHPDYAAAQIGKSLGTFTALATAEGKANRIDKDKQTRPWRVDAAKLKEALASLKTNNDKNAFVAQVADRGSALLDKVIRGTDIDANELTWWSSPQSDAPSKELFQGVPDSVVKPAQSAGAAPGK